MTKLTDADVEPTDVCIDCGKEIVVGFLRCVECDARQELDEEFDAIQASCDPRR